MMDAPKSLHVPIPPEMEGYRTDLEYFFQTMVRKLHTNRHKGVNTDLNVEEMLDRAGEEINEAQEALMTTGQFETAVECADAANFLFLAASAVLNITREEFKEYRQ